MAHSLLALAGVFLLGHAGQMARAGKHYLDAKTAAIKDPTKRAEAQAGLELLGTALQAEGPAIVKSATAIYPEAGVAAAAVVAGFEGDQAATKPVQIVLP
ncbi:MAG: hypothetical protein M3Y56_13715 [Armatimonadota bacterium]|nr:hypothetical protein [Armatimonadota bacterium]